jgi:hypothetical protein
VNGFIKGDKLRKKTRGGQSRHERSGVDTGNNMTWRQISFYFASWWLLLQYILTLRWSWNADNLLACATALCTLLNGITGTYVLYLLFQLFTEFADLEGFFSLLVV